MLVAAGILVNSWAYLGEAHVGRQELKNFPAQSGRWKQEGGDQRFDAQTMSVLRTTDYLLRGYRLGMASGLVYTLGTMQRSETERAITVR